MAFFDLFERLPSASIGLRVFKKKFQIRAGGSCIVFDEQHHVTACSMHQAAKVVIALGRITGQHATFAQHLGQQRLERTDFMVLLGNRALLHHHAGLHLIHMQHLLLRLLAPIELLAGTFQGFAIHGQMDMPLAWLRH